MNITYRNHPPCRNLPSPNLTKPYLILPILTKPNPTRGASLSHFFFAFRVVREIPLPHGMETVKNDLTVYDSDWVAWKL